MRKLSLFIFLLFLVFTNCQEENIPLPERSTGGLYVEQYDQVSDKGQYWLPEMTVKPLRFWSLTDVVGAGYNNSLRQTDQTRGLQYHLMSQSLAGLTNKAVEEGRSKVAVWLHDHSGQEPYKQAKQGLLNMEIEEQGAQNGVALARNSYGISDGVEVELKGLFDGYVLTDVENNPESNMVATVASHVYNSIIVDVRDKTFYEAAGYTMTYDARNKTTWDAWREFKDKCNNEALVVMPVQTGQLREFVIKNKLFILNLNKEFSNPAAGQNLDLFKEVLEWLKPNSSVYGWEQGVGEDVFVNRVSEHGHMMVAYDWAFNTSLTSLKYKDRQPGLAGVLNPRFIDFEEKDTKYVSFYLSDGDNVQWMMGGFGGPDYYTHPEASNMKMGFGLPIDNLSMIAPDALQGLFNTQPYNTSIVQTLGGGYNYADNLGVDANRAESLKNIPEAVAAHMRQHRVKVLALMARDSRSASAKAAYQAYVDANDQLEGIISVQYSPYAGGRGEIMWMKNNKGYDIPVITVKYSIWNFGGSNHAREGTPTYIAKKLNSEPLEDPFNLVMIHAWSRFSDIGDSMDETAENQNGQIVGAGAAKLCADKLEENIKVINVEEMIWRVRMQYRPEETKKYLSEVF